MFHRYRLRCKLNPQAPQQLVQLPQNTKKGPLRHEPDFIVEQFTIQRMNADGQIQSSLTAKKMTHYADDESTDLDAPRFVQRNPDQPPMEAISERGVITKDGETVFMKDNVVVTRAPTADRGPLVLKTTILEVLPKDEIARTDAPVVITEGTMQLEGTGMRVNSKTRDFELLSKVRGKYQPEATK